ncbi:MAG: hypothetical protein ORN54_15045 [Cyclobacteriaceae bacterium]|nr:hypothetical protein [Cyclobacteriaceae bacterium]
MPVKIFIIISTPILAVIGSLLMVSSKGTKPEITTLSSENLLVLKASRKFKDAEIEVFSSSGYFLLAIWLSLKLKS